MRVFLSWSGDNSRLVAEALRDWLPRVIQAVRPWLSAHDIDAGARWSEELTRELQTNGFGVICVNRENMEKPWLLFEAGALSRTVPSARVCPFLLGLRSADLVGPLAQFQAVEAEQEQVLKLVISINRALGDSRLTDDQLDESFGVWWPRLAAKLDPIRTQSSAQTAMDRPRRAVEDMVAEVLEILRKQQRRDIIEAEVVEEIRGDDIPRQVADETFPIGGRVTHPKFGAGRVSSIRRMNGSMRISVKFDDGLGRHFPLGSSKLRRAD